MKKEEYEKILNQAPLGATHYHRNMGIYYKFTECMGMADAYLCGEWQDYPLYPSISALSDIEIILSQICDGQQ